MCIAAPAKIVDINKNKKMATVDFGGVKQKIRIDLVEDEVDIGTYVLVHSGYAIEVMSEKAAKESLEVWEEMMHQLNSKE